MELTNDMLQAAIDKAVEAGLLPKAVRKDASSADREVMKMVLQAALNVEAEHAKERLSRASENMPPL